MDRELTTETLIDYHFGTLEPAARAAVEEALLASEQALRAYLGLKRALDGASAAAEGPSEAARARLRTAVSAEVSRARGRAGLGGLLSRPVPLYQTLAVAAAVALGVGLWRRPPVAPARPPVVSGAGQSVDLVRPSAGGREVF